MMRPSRNSNGSVETQRCVFDAVVAVLAIVALSPLWVLIAALVRLESPGPVFFRQKRIGRGGRTFEVIKFRSMAVAAPAETRVAADVGDIEAFQFRPTGRMTVVGRALRACSLDELPNLLNVLRGEMHIVGPRPDEPELVAQYRPEWRRRVAVRPGLTGLAQVNGRNDLTYSEMMAYDLAYVDDHPFWRDVKIMLKTLGVVLRREGAR